MSFTFIAAVSGGNDAAGTTLDTSSSLNVAAGDTLAAWCGHEGANGTFAVAKTTGGNDFTFDAEDEENHSNGDLNGSWGYLLSAAADATFTGRFTSSSREFRRIIILQFRPDSGDTVSKDGSAAGQGTSTAANSGNFTTAGTDGMACGGYKEYTSATTSSELINGGAATEPTGSPVNFTSAWYAAYSSGFTGAASATVGANAAWICGGIAFKSEAAAGGDPEGKLVGGKLIGGGLLTNGVLV